MIDIPSGILCLEKDKHFVVDFVYQEGLHFVSEVDFCIHLAYFIRAEKDVNTVNCLFPR